jgi:hypothetical protein
MAAQVFLPKKICYSTLETYMASNERVKDPTQGVDMYPDVESILKMSKMELLGLRGR